jgi:uncharacterized membrane protein
MPHQWSQTPDIPDSAQPALTLWPYRSLPRRGFALMILMAFGLSVIPLIGVMGTMALWGILPFILLMVGGLWLGLEKSYKSGEILEELCLEGDDLCLTHTPVKGPRQEWRCNGYWVRVEMHVSGGKVPFYVTLSGNGRQVEIGSFLSEDERKTLHGELKDYLKTLRQKQVE